MIILNETFIPTVTVAMILLCVWRIKYSDQGINNHLNMDDYLKHNPPRVKYKYIQIQIQLKPLITMHTMTTSQNNRISQNTYNIFTARIELNDAGREGIFSAAASRDDDR